MALEQGGGIRPAHARTHPYSRAVHESIYVRILMYTLCIFYAVALGCLRILSVPVPDFGYACPLCLQRTSIEVARRSTKSVRRALFLRDDQRRALKERSFVD